MDKERYEELLDNHADIELTDEDIVEWLDRIVEPLVEVQKNVYDLYWGTIKNGEYTNSISTCFRDYLQVHIYEGIERLAKAVGETVSHKSRGSNCEYTEEFYFEYKGVHIFEIRE